MSEDQQEEKQEPKPEKKAKVSKFTFKKHPKETGLASVGRPYPDTVIKYQKKECGLISAPSWMTKDMLWRIRFQIVQESEHCGWKWIQLKRTFESEPEARTFINENVDRLLALNLHFSDSED